MQPSSRGCRRLPRMLIDHLPKQLEAWHDFYLVVGTGAAALTGLLFVIVSLGPHVIRIVVQGTPHHTGRLAPGGAREERRGSIAGSRPGCVTRTFRTASSTARGLPAMTCSRTSAGPVGRRLPRSQWRSVANGNPK